MKILLLAATQPEIQPFLHAPHKVDVLIGGVGIASTIYKLTKQLHHHYDLVIQAGIAGAFAEGGTKKITPANVVIVKQDCFADLGATENGKFSSIQQMGFDNGPEWIVNTHPLLSKLSYEQVSAITVNTITDNANAINMLQHQWRADIESMEGAALHYVCSHQHTPYLQIRAVSNTVGVRDKKQWYIQEAVAKLNEALTQVIDNLLK